jgi:hypothetical protein
MQAPNVEGTVTSGRWQGHYCLQRQKLCLQGSAHVLEFELCAAVVSKCSEILHLLATSLQLANCKV